LLYKIVKNAKKFKKKGGHLPLSLVKYYGYKIKHKMAAECGHEFGGYQP
jgi:hypothetical protein